MVDDRPGPDSGDRGRDRCTVIRSDLDGMSLGVAIPVAVVSGSDANVFDLDPLSDVVDVDALDAIWGPLDASQGAGSLDASQGNPRTRVTFTYMGYEVTVTPVELHLAPLDDGRGDGAHGFG